MKEASFKGIRWTKTFVTGPLDPLITNISFTARSVKPMYSRFSKGTREIIRHYQGESHLRKDQRWRLEHSRSVDEVTATVKHHVRGKDGHVLTAFELEKKKPLFEDAPIVDIGESFPFYDEYIASLGGQKTSEDLHASTQIALIGKFVPHDGNVLLLQTLWTRTAEFMNHKEQFSPFKWSSATLTVS